MNIKLYTKHYLSAAAALAIAGSFAVALPAFAQTNGPSNTPPGANASAHGQWGMGQGAPGMAGMKMGPKPAAFGTVTGVNGDIITINSRQGFASTSPTTVLTVDATNATVVKNNATSSISSVATGDTISVQGTLSGTNVVATSIRDGVMRPMMGNGMGKGGPRSGGMGSSTSAMPAIGNGEPVVAGTVSAINGSSLTITTKSNVTYTVDASNAKVLTGQTTASLSNVIVGDSVLVQGTVNGTSVTATSVIDQSHSSTVANGSKTAPAHGLLGGIGQFFMHLFGF
jgi:hypothetical protein